MSKVEFVKTPIIKILLSKFEAETLAAILSNVGGDPCGRRKDLDSIHEGLTRLGIDDDKVRMSGLLMVHDGQ